MVWYAGLCVVCRTRGTHWARGEGWSCRRSLEVQVHNWRCVEGAVPRVGLSSLRARQGARRQRTRSCGCTALHQTTWRACLRIEAPRARHSRQPGLTTGPRSCVGA